MKMRCSVCVLLFCVLAAGAGYGEASSYEACVRACLDTLLAHGTDRYGTVKMPIFVSILDGDGKTCPENPLPCDEACRVVRRDRRNPAGANLLTGQPLIKTLYAAADCWDTPKYGDAADAYLAAYLERLVDEKGFLWWGWHRHYDVYKDTFTGHNGNHHEIHAIHDIAWDRLWDVNPGATRREIEAIWTWHVIDKTTGEVNRHGDGQRGCDFAMSAGSFLNAFAFLYHKTQEQVWLDRARLLSDYYHERRNPDTGLFPDRPNAGADRFDGSAFVTSITGCYCHALMNAYRLTGAAVFRDRAETYLLAYAKYGYDEEAERFWGALRMDGTPVAGPRTVGDYAQYEPRGHLDLWEPYVAGYQYAIYTAQAYAEAYALTGNPALLETAKRFAAWIRRVPPGSVETARTWYSPYTEGPGKEGTYAGKYGRAVSFFLQIYALTGEESYLEDAKKLADEAVAKLFDNGQGLFKGHPAKPYYEAMDGVGYLLYALLCLDAVQAAPERFRMAPPCKGAEAPLPLVNW